MLVVIAALAIVVIAIVTPLIAWAIPFSRTVRILIAVATLVPIGVALGVPMPAGLRLLSSRAPQITGIDSTYTSVAPAIISPFNYGITQAAMNSDGSLITSWNRLSKKPRRACEQSTSIMRR